MAEASQQTAGELSSHVLAVARLENLTDIQGAGHVRQIEEEFQKAFLLLQQRFQSSFRTASGAAASSVRSVLGALEADADAFIDLAEFRKLADDVVAIRLAWGISEDIAIRTQAVVVAWHEEVQAVATSWMAELHEHSKQILARAHALTNGQHESSLEDELNAGLWCEKLYSSMLKLAELSSDDGQSGSKAYLSEARLEMMMCVKQMALATSALCTEAASAALPAYADIFLGKALSIFEFTGFHDVC